MGGGYGGYRLARIDMVSGSRRLLVIGLGLALVAGPSLAGNLLDGDGTENFECDADMEVCEGGGDSSEGGDTNTDRQWIWTEHNASGWNHSTTYYAASSTGDITCYNTLLEEPDESSIINLRIAYSCNDDFALKIPQPEIALVATDEGQKMPRCGSGDHCGATIALIPIYGSWSGEVSVSISQDGAHVAEESHTFDSESYGLIQTIVKTDRSSDFQLTIELADGTGVIDRRTENVTVHKQQDQFWIQAAEFVQWGRESEYLFAARASLDERGDACLRVTTEDGSTFENFDRDTDAVRVPTGSDSVPAHAKVGPSCGDWVKSVNMTQQDLGE